MAPITRGVAAKLAQQKNKKSTHSSTTGKPFLGFPRRTMEQLTRCPRAKRAQQNKKKSTHSSTIGQKFLSMPSRTMEPLIRSAAAKMAEQKKTNHIYSSTTGDPFLETAKKKLKPTIRANQAQQKSKSTQSSTTGKISSEMPKRTIAPVTRSAVAKQAQQKIEESLLCDNTTGNKPFIVTRIIRNPYRWYGLHLRIEKQLVTPIKSKQFKCIFCNKTTFCPAKPQPSRAVGTLGCKSCGAQYRFRVTAELSCAEDVRAALLAGDCISWLSATQGPRLCVDAS